MTKKNLVRENFSFFHNCVLHITVWKNEKFTLTEEKFREINSCKFFNKNVAFTKFLSKKCESKFPQFPQCGTFSFLNSNLRQNGRVFFQLKIQYNFLKMLTRWQCKYSKLFCLADSNKYSVGQKSERKPYFTL